MPKIPLYPSSVAPNDDDLLILEDSVTSNTKKIKRSDLLGGNTITATNDIKTDAINGITDADSGDIYGITVTNGKMSGDDLTAASVPPDALATGAANATVATSETTTSTSYADLTTKTDTVTVTIGANGLALIVISCLMINDTGDATSSMSFVLSGANTVAAATAHKIMYQQQSGPNHQIHLGATFLFTGLTAGSTTFKAKYAVSAGTGTFSNRRIGVVPL